MTCNAMRLFLIQEEYRLGKIISHYDIEEGCFPSASWSFKKRKADVSDLVLIGILLLSFGLLFFGRDAFLGNGKLIAVQDKYQHHHLSDYSDNSDYITIIADEAEYRIYEDWPMRQDLMALNMALNEHMEVGENIAIRALADNPTVIFGLVSGDTELIDSELTYAAFKREKMLTVAVGYLLTVGGLALTIAGLIQKRRRKR